MRYLFAIALAAVALIGCQKSSTVRESATNDVYKQLEGASLVLNQEITVASGKARVFVQNGAVRYGFDSYKPHCAFEINSINHDGYAIEADTFAITRVQRSMQEVVSTGPARFAALQLASGMGGGGGGSASYFDGYHFWLSSVQQPGVRRMSCFGVFAQPYELYPPTVEDIRQVLGSLAEIR
jgi:hypothetical protein